MTISRRDALKGLAAVPALMEAGGSSLQAGDQPRLQAEDAVLKALAEIVLPADADRTAALASFVSWHEHYRENADTDHGYGVTRVRTTGPAPAGNYPAQLAALDSAARSMGAPSFARAPIDQRRAIVEAALAGAKIERLPARPTGGHVASDLMGHFFNSSPANDLCYRAAINRDACRGLAGSDVPPAGGKYGDGE